MNASSEPGDAPSKNGHLWRVAVEAPLPDPLTYRVPPELLNNPNLRRGTSVRVPLGSRQVSGLLLAPAEEAGPFKLKNIVELNEARPTLHENFLGWLEWLARYYIHPIGQVTELAFPPLKKSEKKRKTKKSPVAPSLEQTPPPQLSAEQANVLRAIRASAGFAVHLLHGVTGSGKTEVYIRLVEDMVASGKQAIVLVPEISLTPQLTQRFARRLGDAVAVIHSHLTPREKTDQWWAMIEGKRQVLLGARSALFCPLDKLGLIIVDEEHEGSFKQDEMLKYHARDAAIMLAKFSGCPIVLGSATPSLESWHNASRQRYQFHEMKNRVEDRPMPTIEVVDLRNERDKRKIKNTGQDLPFWMSTSLFEAIVDTQNNGKQAALFLNRRGVAQSVVCPACGFVPECPNCAVSLTLHGKSHLLCHYCDYHQNLRSTCTECREGEPRPLGMGTELVEQDLQRLFPAARIARMDRDEITTREDLEAMIGEIEKGDIDLIVGTQMIAKGLDFPNLTLVGLVLADVAFNLPDFRAAERAFQLLTQVSGRSGRHVDESNPGRVIIQTYNPDHPSVRFTQLHDYSGFAQYEMNFREQLHYPPYWRLSAFRIQGLDLDKVKQAALTLKFRATALQASSPAFHPIEILGPAQCPLAKLRNNHRYHLLLKGPDAGALGRFCRALLTDVESWLPAAVKINIDVDAINLL